MTSYSAQFLRHIILLRLLRGLLRPPHVCIRTNVALVSLERMKNKIIEVIVSDTVFLDKEGSRLNA